MESDEADATAARRSVEAVSLWHHVAIRVADIERSIRFYREVFGGKMLTLPRRVDGAMAARVMDGPSGTRFDTCRIGFDAGCLELFQFIGPEVPDWSTCPPGRVPHFGIVVPDVSQAVERIEQAGGRRLWPEVERWGPAATMYACDLDGNVFELVDTPLESLVRILTTMFPETDPAAGAHYGSDGSAN
jgi:catechol 2,3-dioxygenase-like lactoylglutathione lyase family enzyme